MKGSHLLSFCNRLWRFLLAKWYNANIWCFSIVLNLFFLNRPSSYAHNGLDTVIKTSTWPNLFDLLTFQCFCEAWSYPGYHISRPHLWVDPWLETRAWLLLLLTEPSKTGLNVNNRVCVPGPLSGCSFPFLQPPFFHPTAPCLLTFMVVDLFKNLKWFLENVIHAGVCGVDKTCLNIIVPPLFPSSLWIFFFYYNIPLPSVMIVEIFACHLILFSPSVSFPLSTELCLTIIFPQLSISCFFCSS